ncbi:hypothetical protein [Embleya sp. NPDC050493]|uniref:hypothetical protein n=1 Tax=Embleya sp. NPDC050493 TaxID=3363989 RepID=UPI0037AF1FAA
MMNPSRVMAAGLAAAAAWIAFVPAAFAVPAASAAFAVPAALGGPGAPAAPAAFAAEPGSGITIVVTGDDHYVAADDVVVRHRFTERSAEVEIAAMRRYGSETGPTSRTPGGRVDPHERNDPGRR